MANRKDATTLKEVQRRESDDAGSPWHWWAVAGAGVVIIAICWTAIRNYNVDAVADEWISVQEIEHTPTPRYVAAGFPAAVRDLGRLPDRMNAGDPALLFQLHDAFAAHPWVASVERVIKVGLRRIQVDLRFRMPVAYAVIQENHY